MSRFLLRLLFSSVILLSLLLAASLAHLASDEVWDPHGVALVLVACLAVLGVYLAGRFVARLAQPAPHPVLATMTDNPPPSPAQPPPWSQPAAQPAAPTRTTSPKEPQTDMPELPQPEDEVPELPPEPVQAQAEEWVSEEGVQEGPVPEDEEEAMAAADTPPRPPDPAAEPVPAPGEPAQAEPPDQAEGHAVPAKDDWVSEEGVQDSPLAPTEEPQEDQTTQAEGEAVSTPAANPQSAILNPQLEAAPAQVEEQIQAPAALSAAKITTEEPTPATDANPQSAILNPQLIAGPPIHRVEIRPKLQFGDPHADGVLHQVHEMGIDTVQSVRSVRLFFLFGDLDAAQADRVARELLIDPVVEEYALRATPAGSQISEGENVIEVHLKPGVMDPVAASTEQAIRDMGLDCRSVRTGRRYELAGTFTPAQRETIARRLLANAVIEDVYLAAHTPAELHGHGYQLRVTEIPIRDLDEGGLTALSRDGHLFLNPTEMKAIQDHYRSLGREPRDIELEMIAQTWSEHCVHKTFRSDVSYSGVPIPGGWPNQIPNLIKSTIFGATQKLACPWCISVFQDNAGVIEFDDQHAVCFKVETHNHPSAIEPYGGASTGIGGVIRDPMGTGMGAAPVANTDIFCFGPPDMKLQDVPKGVLHPRRVMRGVVGGVRDYGNRMGIPTVNGAVYFDERYLGNPLVFCGTIGLLPRDKCFKQPLPGDAVLVVGGRTGRDGIHGATFSSGELTHSHETVFSHAVQIGNAITEKKTLDTILQARDQGLYTAITDCGAGGLSSAVGEMGSELGAEVHLDRVPLKYAGLSYPEIWISEAQERMVLSVPQENLGRILKIFADEGVEAVVIGTYGTPDRHLRLFYQDTLVGDVDLCFLNEGLPRPTKQAVWNPKPTPSPAPSAKDNYNAVLLGVLALPNVASKEWIIRQYDHEVQGGSVVKPLVGVTEDGPGDAAVLRPVLDSPKAVVVSCGMNPRLGDLDPYQSALHSVDEALRNAVAVGGRLDRTAILDNFCWGNCNKSDRMGSLVQAACACHDAAIAYGTPFISGKDSLNNEFQTDTGETIAIPPTLLISAISVIDDAAKCVTADAKEPGNYLFLLGRTGSEMGGSHYLLCENLPTGNDVPPVDLATNKKVMRALEAAIQAGCVRACHDLSEGGLAVAAAEMAFSGGLGVEINIDAIPVRGLGVGPAALLFGESAGRFLVEVAPAKYGEFMKLVKDCPFGEIGKVTKTGRVILRPSRGKPLVDVAVGEAKKAWQGTFGE